MPTVFQLPQGYALSVVPPDTHVLEFGEGQEGGDQGGGQETKLGALSSKRWRAKFSLVPRSSFLH